LLERADIWARDPETFIEENLQVRDIEGGRLVPFMLTIGQRIVVRRVRWRLQCGRPARLLILKSRRQRISSVSQALAYWYASTRAYVEALVCADVNDLTEEIFERNVMTYYRTDARREYDLRPQTETSSKRELKFGNPDRHGRDVHPGLQSLIVVTSAESKEPGRGGTKHFIHGSEVPYWPEEPPPWNAMGPSLSDAPDTVAILEGTANGATGLFFELWTQAVKKKNEWTPIFLAWWIDPRNRKPLEPGEREAWRWGTEHETAAEEEAYAKRWRLALEQAKWRRATIASAICYKPGVSRIDVFRQEYPAEWREAFLASSRNFFLIPKVDALERHPEKGARAPLYRARVVNEGPPLDDRGPGHLTPVKPIFEKDRQGELAVYHEFDKSEEYLVVVDPAEGIQGKDEHAIGVLARNAFHFAAIFRSQSLSTREIAHVAALLGWFYERALLVVEANNHGGAVLQELTRILYPRLWYHLDVTKPGSAPTEKPGWIQSSTTRMYALKLLESELRTQTLGIHEPDFFDQCRHFVWPKPRVTGMGAAAVPHPAAAVGHRDDLVLMASIALAVHVNAGIARRRDLPAAPADPNRPLYAEPIRTTSAQAYDRRQKRRIRGTSLWGRGTRR
jgi:hypothetical protein